jgi:hypothetical protein
LIGTSCCGFERLEGTGVAAGLVPVIDVSTAPSGDAVTGEGNPACGRGGAKLG